MPFKYPRLVEYVTELPKTGTGKIDRQALGAAPDQRQIDIDVAKQGENKCHSSLGH